MVMIWYPIFSYPVMDSGESMGCIEFDFSWSHNGAFWAHYGLNPQLDSWKIPLDWDDIWLRLLFSRLT